MHYHVFSKIVHRIHSILSCCLIQCHILSLLFWYPYITTLTNLLSILILYILQFVGCNQSICYWARNCHSY